MFYSIKELVEQADLDYQGNVAELMIATEYELTGRERDEVLRLMGRNLEVMKASVLLGLDESKSRSGLTGGDAAKLDHYIQSGKTLSDYTVLTAAKNAIAVNEHNAKMGLVCATPTAGSAGCLPAVLTSAIEKLGLSEEEQLNFLLAAGAFGLVIANNASISGAEGGCQAEVGSASAMSAAASATIAFLFISLLLSSTAETLSTSVSKIKPKSVFASRTFEHMDSIASLSSGLGMWFGKLPSGSRNCELLTSAPSGDKTFSA